MLGHKALVKICSAFIEPNSIVSSEKLLNGLSNDNFLIRTNHSAYLLKCYKTHWPTIALKAQQQLSKGAICPAPVWLDKQNQRAAFEYIEGDISNSLAIKLLVKKLVKIHRYTIKTKPMDLPRELLFYQHSPVYKQYQTAIKNALQLIQNMPFDEGFCHNDLVKDNIITNLQGVYLIDFEYAKTNDLYFDLAALAINFKLSKEREIELLQCYASYADDFVASLKKLNCYKLLFLVLSIGWYEQRNINNKGITLRAQLQELTNLVIF